MKAIALHSAADRGGWLWLGRIMEIVPGVAAWSFLLSPIWLSFIQPVWAAYLIIAYDLLWLSKAFGLSYRLLRGYGRMRQMQGVDWYHRLADLKNLPAAIAQLGGRLKHPNLTSATRAELRRYRRYLSYLLKTEVSIMDPDTIHHAVVVATYNESLATLEPTIKSIVGAHHPLNKLWLIIAYEERGGQETQANAEYLIKRYGRKFAHAVAIKHPANLPGELKAKAGNITFAARQVTTYAKSRGIDPERVLVTTLDADNRPHPRYFSYLSFVYASTPNRTHKSYQPLPMFLNNIWDVPAPMRVLATGNSFWIMMESMRPHRLRNFSAHAQSLQTLIDTDYWNIYSIVEDGHQFWRTYFRYAGDHQVIPLYLPVFQDAVLSTNFWRTLKAQFKQLRRWAWGASDISYVFVNNLRHKEISWTDKWMKFGRLFEGHFTWATASLVIAFAAWLPLLLNPEFGDLALAYQLPVIASRIQQVASVGIIVTIFVSLVALPPRPARYKRRRSLMMVAQWVLLPVVAIFIHSTAALNAQTRLMLGKYLKEFDVTEKVVVDA